MELKVLIQARDRLLTRLGETCRRHDAAPAGERAALEAEIMRLSRAVGRLESLYESKIVHK